MSFLFVGAYGVGVGRSSGLRGASKVICDIPHADTIFLNIVKMS